MATATLEIIDTNVQKTRLWLKDIMEVLGTEDSHRAYQALRAVLHALRDRITPEEAADLGAQLPHMVRGIYYEAYRPSGKPLKLRTPEEFLSHVQQEIASDDLGAKEAAQAVFTVLQQRISSGEIQDVTGMLPKDIQKLIAV